MPKLEEVYQRLEKNKKERREINKMFKDELASTPRYQEINEELKTLREERKSIENEIKESSSHEAQKLEELKYDIQTDQELLADIALNMYANDQNVEIIDEHEQAWYPQFKVTFKRGS